MTDAHPRSAFAGREPVTTCKHDRPWTADLTTPAHERDRSLVVAEAVDAVEQTRPETHVDIVTPDDHGDPGAYLFEALTSVPGAGDVQYDGRCQCGNYVTIVPVVDPRAD